MWRLGVDHKVDLQTTRRLHLFNSDLWDELVGTSILKLLKVSVWRIVFLVVLYTFSTIACAAEKLPPVNENGRLYAYALLFLEDGMRKTADLCSKKFPETAPIWTELWNELQKIHGADFARFAEMATEIERNMRAELLNQNSAIPIEERQRRFQLFQKAKTLHVDLAVQHFNAAKDVAEQKSRCDRVRGQNSNSTFKKESLLTPDIELIFKSLAQ